jgi:multisubunit Na+/H+ antiporter MnhF subunit
MSRWIVVVLVLMAGGLLPALAVVARGSMSQRLIGYEFAQTVAVPVLLCLGEAVKRSAYVDVALVLAVLSPAVLIYTKFFGGQR